VLRRYGNGLPAIRCCSGDLQRVQKTLPASPGKKMTGRVLLQIFMDFLHGNLHCEAISWTLQRAITVIGSVKSAYCHFTPG